MSGPTEVSPAGRVVCFGVTGSSSSGWREPHRRCHPNAKAKEASGPEHVAQAVRAAEEAMSGLAVYLRLADAVLERADKCAYRDAVRHLKGARRAATNAEQLPEFAGQLTALRERKRRRPTFMAMLDKAGLR